MIRRPPSFTLTDIIFPYPAVFRSLVFGGLFLRVRNEAELAAVLGHEFGHFEQRHSLARVKAQRSGSDLLSWAAVLATLGNTYQSHSNFDSIQLSSYGKLFRFNRDPEREADRKSVV